MCEWCPLEANEYDPDDEVSEWDYPPCAICGGPNDLGEVCAQCAKDHGQGPLAKTDEESQYEEMRDV